METCSSGPPEEFTGSVVVDRGAKGQVEVILEYPRQVGTNGCYDYDIWGLSNGAFGETAKIREVPTFPNAPIERRVSTAYDCSSSPGVICTRILRHGDDHSAVAGHWRSIGGKKRLMC